MAPLDGKEAVKPTPFDAHEQVARVQHEAVPNEEGYAHSGLQVVDRDDDVVGDYPKAVDHVDHPSGVGKQPIVVNSFAEEADYLDQKAAAAETETKSE